MHGNLEHVKESKPILLILMISLNPAGLDDYSDILIPNRIKN